MVYKKYIKRNGKVFGPYYYESYRDENGRVKTRFVNGPASKYKKEDRKTRKKKSDKEKAIAYPLRFKKINKAEKISGVYFVLFVLIVLSFGIYLSYAGFSLKSLGFSVSDDNLTLGNDSESPIDISVPEPVQDNETTGNESVADEPGNETLPDNGAISNETTGNETSAANESAGESLSSEDAIVYEPPLNETKNKSEIVFAVLQDTTPPNITFESPTPANGTTQTDNSAYLNATITDESNTSAFFDFNGSLRGYWAMDFFNNSVVFDNSSNNNVAKFINLTNSSIFAGYYGDGFNASSTFATYLRVEDNDSLDITDEITIEAWIRLDSVNRDFQTIVAKRITSAAQTANYGFRMGNGSRDDEIEFYYANSGFQVWTTSATNFVTGTWYHVAATYNGSGNASIYVNGVLQPGLWTTGSGGTSMLANTLPMYIGADPRNILFPGATSDFRGIIDELSIHSRILSGQEINASYNNSIYRLERNFTDLPDGTYNYAVYAIDNEGNLNISNERIFTIESANLTINITHPQNISYNVNVSELNYTTNSDGSCWYSINNGITNSSFVSAGVNFTSVSSFEGSNTWRVYCNATFDNQSSSLVVFFKDTLPPNLSADNITTINQSGVVDGVVERGTNVTFNVTNDNYNSTWVVVWEGIAGISNKLFEGFFSLIGSIWTLTTGTNESWIIGEQNYTIYVNDSLGNEINVSKNVTIVESIPPIVNITYPENITYYDVNVSELNYTVSEINGSCWYSVNNGVTNSTPVAAGVNFTGVTSVEGNNTWIVYCNDTFGNENSSSVVFGKQITPKIIFISPTPANGTNQLENSVYLNTTITDDSNTSAFFDFNKSLGGYWSFDYYSDIDGARFFDNSSYENSAFYINVTSADLVTGVFGKAIEFNGVDEALSIADSSSLNVSDEFTIDLWIYKNTDSVSHERLISKSNFTNFSVFLQLDTADLVQIGFKNSTGQINYLLSNSVVPNATWTHIVAVKNNTGFKIYINGILDAQGITSGMMSDVELNNYEWNFGRLGSGNSWFYNFSGIIDEVKIHLREISGQEVNASFNNSAYRLERNFTGLTNGTYNYAAYAIDNWGNLNASDYRAFTIGPVNLTINITYPQNISYNVNVSELNYTTNSDGSCWYSINNGVTNSSFVSAGVNFTSVSSFEGSNTWRVYCNATFDNQSSSLVVFFKDTLPPNLSADNITTINQSGVVDGVVERGTNVTFNVSDDGYDSVWIEIWKGIAGISDILFRGFLSLIGGIWTLTTGTNASWIIGEQNYTIYVNDSLGNEANISKNVTIVDTTPPIVNITYPENISYNVNVSELNYTANSDGSCWYSINNGVTNSSPVAAGQNFTNVMSLEGSNTWIVYCNDSEGNEGRNNITFFKDTASPTVNITYPQNTSYNINVSELNYTANSDGSCWYSINNGITNSSPVAAGINFTGVTSIEGSNAWRVYCNDTFGNENSSLVVFFKDTLPPNLSADNITTVNDSGVDNGVVERGTNIEFDVTDDGYDSVWIEVWDELVGSDILFRGFLSFVGGIWSITTQTNTSWAIGEQNYTIYVNDSIGNEANVSKNATIVDTTNPVVNITFPVENTTYTGSVSTIDYIISEIDGSCWYSTNSGVTNSTPVAAGVNFTGVTSVEGSNTWTVYCNDSVGNAGESNVTFTVTIPAPPSGGGGGGGGGGLCIPEVTCGNWTACINGKQTLTCERIDSFCIETITEAERDCVEEPAPEEEPEENVTEEEEVPVSPDYSCGEWGECLAVYGIDTVISGDVFLGGEQTRTCTDRTGAGEDITDVRGCNPGVEVDVLGGRGRWNISINGSLVSEMELNENRLDIYFPVAEPGEEMIEEPAVGFCWWCWLIILLLVSGIFILSWLIYLAGWKRRIEKRRRIEKIKRRKYVRKPLVDAGKMRPSFGIRMQ